VREVEAVARRVDRLEKEYRNALAGLMAKACARVGELAAC
jgi:hypothetical protein